MSKSKIEWTDETWNPVTGCAKVSSGCKHCYAERLWKRLSANPKHVAYGRPFTDVQCHPERLELPLCWKKPRHVFVNSMSDLFHENVPDDFINRVFAVMALCPQHTFQILTKRPERMLEYLTSELEPDCGWLPGSGPLWRCNALIGSMPIENMKLLEEQWDIFGGGIDGNSWPLMNVWLGVSVENQETADERIPLLLRTPAAVRFISIEPMLGPVDLSQASYGHGKPRPTLDIQSRQTNSAINAIDWIIVGGESGPKARPMHPDWVRSVRDQCQSAGVPYFFKQWGEWSPDCLHLTRNVPCRATPRPRPGRMGCMFMCGKKTAGRILDGRVWNQYPDDSRRSA